MELTVNTGELMALIALGSAVCGLIFSAFKLWQRFRRLERGSEYRQEDTEMMLKGLLACLVGLKEQGCNGKVTETLDLLNSYMVSKAAGYSGRK